MSSSEEIASDLKKDIEKEKLSDIGTRTFRFKSYDRLDPTQFTSLNKKWNTTTKEMQQLRSIRDFLNETRKKISAISIEDWEKHTSSSFPAKNIAREVRRSIQAELCTNAWIKFYEILYDWEVFSSNVEPSIIRTLHLCEAPGGFIGALNHFLHLWYPNSKWLWWGSSLNPHAMKNKNRWMIEDSRFIDATWENWLFGKDKTGDLVNKENIANIWKEVNTTVDLVSGDGSIPCKDNWTTQENLIYPILLAEFICALGCLAPKGTLVLKLFTLFEPATLSLVYTICCYFHDVNFVKPWGSKDGNGEVYLVALEFKGIDSYEKYILLDTLESTIASNDPLVSQQSVPTSFMDDVIACSRLFASLNVHTIESNLVLYENPHPDKYRTYHNHQRFVAKEYINRFEIEKIDPRFRLVQQIYLDGTGPM